jgi:hypothetical protein
MPYCPKCGKPAEAVGQTGYVACQTCGIIQPTVASSKPVETPLRTEPKKRSRKLIIAAIIVLMFLIGVASISQLPRMPSNTAQEYPWIKDVKRAWVVAHPYNWDLDAENDGLRVWVELQDSNEKMVMYTFSNMPLKIEIYSTESQTYPLQPARLLYSGTSTLTNWDHDGFISGANGVKDIPWEAISPRSGTEQQEFGIIRITATLPNGQECNAEYSPVMIQ